MPLTLKKQLQSCYKQSLKTQGLWFLVKDEHRKQEYMSVIRNYKKVEKL
jgi:hypothetical protein